MSQNIYIGKLICKLISLNVNEEQEEELKSFNISQWNQLYDYAKGYNLTPILYSRIYKLSFIEIVPKIILNQLQNDFNSFSRTAMKREFEMKKILKQLNDSNIEVILLKGLYISEAYYDNPAERPMCDVDLLVKQGDVQRTIEVLKDIGCVQEQVSNNDIEPIEFISKLDKLNKFTKHLPEMKTPKGISIELHWTLDYSREYNSTNIDMAEIWKTKEPMQVHGSNFYRIQTELHLLYLCVNIAEDVFRQKILQLFDIFLIINKTKIDWDSIILKAKEWNCQKPLFAVLIAEENIFNLKIPKNIYKELNTVIDFSDDNINFILDSVFADLNIAEQYENKIGSEFSTKGIIGKIKFFYWTFWSRDKIFYHYGVDKGWMKIFLCRIKRTIYLAKKYLSGFLQIYLINSKKKDKIKDQNSNNFELLENWLKK